MCFGNVYSGELNCVKINSGKVCGKVSCGNMSFIFPDGGACLPYMEELKLYSSERWGAGGGTE